MFQIGGGDSIRDIGLKDKKNENRINYLKRKYEVLYDKNNYNKNKYKRFVHVVSREYMMTYWQRQQSKYIIDNHNLRELINGRQYRNVNWEAIVTAICFYFMRKDNPKRPLRYNTDFVRSVSLDKTIYDCIAKTLNGGTNSQTIRNTYYIVEET